MKHKILLKHYPDLVSEPHRICRRDIQSIHPDLPTLWYIHPLDQFGQCAFPGTALPHNTDSAPCRDPKSHIPDHL